MWIREIEKKDDQSMAQIIKRSLESFDLDIPGTAYFDPQLRNLAQFYKQQANAKYWVAVNEQDEVVGGVGIAPFWEKDGVCELQKLYVAPAAQEMGLSKELMNEALTFSRQYYTYCYLETMEILKAANNLYTQFGFQQLESPLDGSTHNTMDTWFLKELSDNRADSPQC
ncbi:GNAT family N-acetyltransferase [Lentibacillus salicampi]|uniref:GNAT family N-acetyltransferase n=1 Tax=Lentibacillus salicampi TaxID=175306 RepID=A0A4Y9AG33_9BACI|nr:GNAT family N-acetyltransferase [Lentibacillus salicampi]TFJ94773.1 GNAT family N-acetyltransferase [Lentibacillus salicampi]